MKQPDDSQNAFDAFLASYWKHRDSGQVEPLSYYLARFRQADESIAREYLALQAEDPESDRQRIGPFAILSEIGRGGQGIVYRAEDTRLGREVALKVLPSGDGAPEQLARFERESKLASRLEHPVICGVHEAGQAGEVNYIAMRLVEGRSLAELLGEARSLDRRMALAQVLRKHAGIATPANQHAAMSPILEIVEQLARGLHAAHQCGVIHRDIKPANVMIEPSGQPVLLDFGLSQDRAEGAHSLTESGAVFGTPDYMSPEQVLGDRHGMGPHTDVYALGVLLFECLTLKRPFERATQAETLTAIRNDAPERLRRIKPHYPSEIDTIIETCLAKKGAKRYQSALHLADELRRVRLHEPIRTRALSAWTRTWRWAQRNPKLAASLASLGVALVGGLIVAILLLVVVDEKRREATLVADLTYLRLLQETARDELATIDPSRVAQFESWLADADRILARRDQHAAAQQALEAASSSEPEGVEQLRSGVHQQHLAALDAFGDPVNTAQDCYASVQERLLLARSLTAASSGSPLWQPAIKAIAQHPLYDGLKLTPQLGLLPLGPDPQSTLWEFAVVHSGSIPQRTPSGSLKITADTCIVVTLIPGGITTIGVAKDKTDPMHECQLAPFFLGKFEVTREQWQRGWGEVPQISLRIDREDRGAQTLGPVTDVDWVQCDQFCQRLALALPTEVQWEHAARCGQKNMAEPADTTKLGNFADQASLLDWNPGWQCDPGDDGWSVSSPIGSFPANRWGLHDLPGNVREWVEDSYVDYPVQAPRAGDGLRGDDELLARRGLRAIRGGSFDQPCPPSFWAARGGDAPDERSFPLGFRVARGIR